MPSYNPELILSDELDGSIISIYLRDNISVLRGIPDVDLSYSVSDGNALRGITSVRNTGKSEIDEAISMLECEIDKILIHAWNGI